MASPLDNSRCDSRGNDVSMPLAELCFRGLRYTLVLRCHARRCRVGATRMVQIVRDVSGRHPRGQLRGITTVIVPNRVLTEFQTISEVRLLVLVPELCTVPSALLVGHHHSPWCPTSLEYMRRGPPAFRHESLEVNLIKHQALCTRGGFRLKYAPKGSTEKSGVLQYR
jgi:hypothetical protein